MIEFHGGKLGLDEEGEQEEAHAGDVVCRLVVVPSRLMGCDVCWWSLAPAASEAEEYRNRHDVAAHARYARVVTQ